MITQYIESKILIEDHNKIFYDIYKNYKSYDFVNREYCKNYLLIVFDELFDKDIDLKIIDDINNKSENNSRIGQDEFKKQIISRFEKCIISDIHHESCQASHIYDLKYEPLNYDINNGILLNATLHLEFDNLKWCIHPNTYKIIISKKYQDQNLEIKKYINKKLESKLDKYPHMRIYIHKKFKKFIEDQQ